MQPRMKNPAMIVPQAMHALHALGKAAEGGVPRSTIDLVQLRASQINGCSACVDAGATSATKAGVSPEKLLTLAAWYEDPRFDDAERAALALTETYGVHFDPALRDEVVARVDALRLPSYSATTPRVSR